MNRQICRHFFNSIFLWSLLIAGLLAPSILKAQNQLKIVEGDLITGGSIEGDEVKKILRNVHLQSENLDMYCDSAYQFVNKNEIRAYGNIEINTGEERIWADTLIYFTDIDFSQLRGRVIIRDDSTTLFSNSVDYRFSTKVGHFIDGIRLNDPQGTLSANSGFYFREPDSAAFFGRVQLSDSLQYAEGDSLFINRRKDYYELYGDLLVDDKDDRVQLKGRYLEADSTGRRLLRGNAWLQQYSDPSDTTAADTTHMQAREIVSTRSTAGGDTTSVIRAYQKVRIWSPMFSAISDTARYVDSTETFVLRGNPKAWHKQIQLTGPYIRVRLDSSRIDSLVSYPTPFAVQQDTAIDRLNQITGDTLTADFHEGSIRVIHVFNNSHFLRFTSDQKGKSDGAIDVTAPETRLYFEKGELVDGKTTGTTDGVFLPESEETRNRRLDGFQWNPDLRPQKPEMRMIRRWPPIPDRIPFELPPRYLEFLKHSSTRQAP